MDLIQTKTSFTHSFLEVRGWISEETFCWSRQKKAKAAKAHWFGVENAQLALHYIKVKSQVQVRSCSVTAAVSACRAAAALDSHLSLRQSSYTAAHATHTNTHIPKTHGPSAYDICGWEKCGLWWLSKHAHMHTHSGTMGLLLWSPSARSECWYGHWWGQLLSDRHTHGHSEEWVSCHSRGPSSLQHI